MTGLTPTEASEVLVRVGERSITLGDFAATLERMDRFERLRYQSEENQKKLLNEMIEVELVAQEAKRRGLDKDPEVQLSLQQALRDELLRKVEAELPAPESISEREVREYYEAHRSEFKEPERRRVLLIEMGSPELAKKVLETAQGASGKEWGELADEYSLLRKHEGLGAAEFSGDVGFVSAPGQQRGENAAVPEPVRAAIFEVAEVGDVVPRVVQDGELHYVVRLGGISPARDRTVSEAERTIRIELRRQKFLQAEKELEAELRKRYPVQIDRAALEEFNASTPSDKQAGTEKDAVVDKDIVPSESGAARKGDPAPDTSKPIHGDSE